MEPSYAIMSPKPSQDQQLSYSSSSSSHFRPINSPTVSTLPSASSSLPGDNTFGAQSQNYQVVAQKTEFRRNIELLKEIERQKEFEKLQEIKRQLKNESLQKIKKLHQSERQNQMERQYQIETQNQFGQDQQNSQEAQSEQADRYTKSQIIYGQWLLRQRQLDPIPRPWTIWAIGIIDILSVVPTVGMVANDLIMKPMSDPTTHLWMFFKVSVFTVIQLLMGVGLLNGLRSRDDSSTLWYCKMWIWCQGIFILDSAFTLFSTLILAAQSTTLPPNFTPFYTGLALKGLYRLVSLILLIRFKNKLRDSQRVFKEAYKKQQEIHMQQQPQYGDHAMPSYNYDQQRNSVGGDVISPYVAVVLGL